MNNFDLIIFQYIDYGFKNCVLCEWTWLSWVSFRFVPFDDEKYVKHNMICRYGKFPPTAVTRMRINILTSHYPFSADTSLAPDENVFIIFLNVRYIPTNTIYIMQWITKYSKELYWIIAIPHNTRQTMCDA